MKLSLSDAVKEAKVAKATLWRAIKNGKVSASRNDKGEYEIDAAELFRVFSPRSSETYQPVSKKQDETHNETLEGSEIQGLRKVIETQETLIASQSETLTDLRGRLNDTERRLDESERERREAMKTLTLLLTNDAAVKTRPRALWAVLAIIIVIVIASLSLLYANQLLPTTK